MLFLLSAFPLFLGFLAFKPTLLGLLRKVDCLPSLWGLIAMTKFKTLGVLTALTRFVIVNDHRPPRRPAV